MLMPGGEKKGLNYWSIRMKDEKDTEKTPEELMQELIEYLEKHPELEEVYAQEKKKNPWRLIF